MNSKLYTGLVEHERFHPASHRLIYKLYMYALDLGELEALDHRFPLFGYNRLRPVSFYDRDYLGRHIGEYSPQSARACIAHIFRQTVWNGSFW